MITESMKLNSRRDANQWAASFDLTDEQKARLANWIWETKPFIGCTKYDHPLFSISAEDFWDITEPLDEEG